MMASCHLFSEVTCKNDFNDDNMVLYRKDLTYKKYDIYNMACLLDVY